MKHKEALWPLFGCFAKIGAFTFGGGYAMISLIQHETTEVHHWATEQDILDILAIAESTPGAIAINAATFIGYRTAGILGAAAATTGLVLPSFFLIFILSFFLDAFQQLQWIQWAFSGIRAGVAVLVTQAVFKMAKPCPKTKGNILLGALCLFLSAFSSISVIYLLLFCGTVGLLRHLLSLRFSQESSTGGDTP